MTNRCHSRHDSRRCIRPKGHAGEHAVLTGAKHKGNRKIVVWVDVDETDATEEDRETASTSDG